MRGWPRVKLTADEGRAVPASPSCDCTEYPKIVVDVAERLTGLEERRLGTW